MDLNNETLRSVFNAFDVDNNGYITVDQFVKTFEQLGNSKELNESFDNDNVQKLLKKTSLLDDWIAKLDPEHDGKIYFDGFVQGIRSLLGSDLESNSEDPKQQVKTLSEDEHFSTEDSGLQSFVTNDLTSPTYDSKRFAGIDCDSVQSHYSSVFSDAVSPSNDIEVAVFSPASKSPCSPHKSTHLNVNSGSYLQPPISPPLLNSSIIRGDDIRNSWPKHRRQNGSRSPSRHDTREISLSASRNGSSRSLNGSTHDLLLDDLDNNFTTLQDQYKRLEEKIDILNTSQNDTNSREYKLKEESQQLVKKLINLEEQLSEMFERNSKDQLNHEKLKLKEKINEIERRHELEMDELRTKEMSLELENNEIKTELAKQQAEVEKHKLLLVKTEHQFNDAQNRVQSLQEDLENQSQSLRKQIDQLKSEKSKLEEIIEELNQELVDLKDKSGENNCSTSEETLENRLREAEELVSKLSRENKALKEQLEDCQAELLSESLQRGQSLIKSTEMSLASEISDYSKEEMHNNLSHSQLTDLLIKEKEANFALREYVETIITRVIERFPEILEIK